MQHANEHHAVACKCMPFSAAGEWQRSSLMHVLSRAERSRQVDRILCSMLQRLLFVNYIAQEKVS